MVETKPRFRQAMLAWTFGWLMLVVGVEAALAIETDISITGRALIVAVLGGGGFCAAAFTAASLRSETGRAAVRQSVAWAFAFTLALVMLVAASVEELSDKRSSANAGANSAAPQELKLALVKKRGTLPEEWARPLVAAGLFGAVGGFLSVMAAAAWRMRLGALGRGTMAGTGWLALFIVGTVTNVLGGYLLSHALADFLPVPSPPFALFVGFTLAALPIGVGIGAGGECITRAFVNPAP